MPPECSWVFGWLRSPVLCAQARALFLWRRMSWVTFVDGEAKASTAHGRTERTYRPSTGEETAQVHLSLIASHLGTYHALQSRFIEDDYTTVFRFDQSLHLEVGKQPADRLAGSTDHLSDFCLRQQ